MKGETDGLHRCLCATFEADANLVELKEQGVSVLFEGSTCRTRDQAAEHFSDGNRSHPASMFLQRKKRGSGKPSSNRSGGLPSHQKVTYLRERARNAFTGISHGGCERVQKMLNTERGASRSGALGEGVQRLQDLPS